MSYIQVFKASNPAADTAIADSYLYYSNGNISEVGPYTDASGNVYIVLFSDTLTPAGGGGFSAQDPSNCIASAGTTDLSSYATTFDGRYIHVAMSINTTHLIRYGRFDTQTDTWVDAANFGGTAGATTALVYTPASTATLYYRQVDIAVRSDGDIIIVHNANTSGSTRQVRVAVWEGSSWSNTLVSGQTSVHPSVVVDSNDVAYITYTGYSNKDFYLRTLSPTNTLGTQRTFAASNSNLTHTASPVVYTRGTTETVGVAFGYPVHTSNLIALDWVSWPAFTDDSSPTFTVTNLTGADAVYIKGNDDYHGAQGVAKDPYDGDTLYKVFADVTNRDVWIYSDGGGSGDWSDANSGALKTGTYDHAFGNIIERGGHRYYAYVYDDGSSIKYAEYDLGTTSSGYTLDATPAASFSLTGISATLPRSYGLTCAAQSYTMTGVSAAPQISRALTGDARSFSLTGISATLTASRALASGVGAVNLSWVSATFQTAEVMGALTQSYTLTGVAADLAHNTLTNVTVDATVQTYTLTGVSAEMTVSRTFGATTRTYGITGISAALTAARALAASQQTYSITGIAAPIGKSIPLDAAVGAFAISGYGSDLTGGILLDHTGDYLIGSAGTLLFDHTPDFMAIQMDAPGETYSISGQASLEYHRIFDVSAGSMTLAGVSASLPRTLAILGEAQTYALAGIDADPARSIVTEAAAQSYALAGADVAYRRDYTLTAEAQAFDVTGALTGLELDGNMSALPQTYALTGYDVAFSAIASLPATTQTYALNGGDATFQRAEVLEATAQSYSLTGVSANLERARTMSTTTRSYALDGTAPAFLRGYTLTADTGSATLTGQSAGLTKQLVSFDVTAGAFTATGNTVTFQRGRVILAYGGIFLISRKTASLTKLANTALRDHGNFVLYDAIGGILSDHNSTAHKTLTAEVAAFSLAGDVRIYVSTRSMAAQTYTLTGGGIAFIKAKYTLNTTSASFIMPGLDITFAHPSRKIGAETQTYAVTWQNATVEREFRELFPDAQTYALTVLDVAFGVVLDNRPRLPSASQNDGQSIGQRDAIITDRQRDAKIGTKQGEAIGTVGQSAGRAATKSNSGAVSGAQRKSTLVRS